MNRNENGFMFSLNGVTWQLDLVDNLFNHKDEYGSCHPQTRTIQVDKNLSKGLRGNTIFHEVVHAILHDMGREELYEDEVFVNGLANGLNQVFEPNIKEVCDK